MILATALVVLFKLIENLYHHFANFIGHIITAWEEHIFSGGAGGELTVLISDYYNVTSQSWNKITRSSSSSNAEAARAAYRFAAVFDTLSWGDEHSYKKKILIYNFHVHLCFGYDLISSWRFNKVQGT